MPRSTLYRERDKLKKLGLIDFTTKGGRSAGRYVINPFGNYLVSQGEKQMEETQQFASHSGTQGREIQQFVSQGGNIYKLNNITNKENIKENFSEEMEVGAEAPPTSTNPTPEKKEKVAPKRKKSASPPWEEKSWVEGLESPWMELMQTWLGYKASRKEKYKSEMSAAKCLEQLKKLAGGNGGVAQEVIDQSIANNWAGLFELKRQPYYARGQPMPAQGQHIGQIKQPKDEEARQKILDKFKPQPIKHKP